VILRDKLARADAAGHAGSLIAGWSDGLADFAPDKAETLTGVSAKRIERIAHAFADMRPAIAIVGGAPLAHTNGLFTALAVNALNALGGNIGEPGGIFFTPPIGSAAAARGAGSAAAGQGASLKDWAASASSQVVLLDGANPVFTAPKAWRVREALEKAQFIASFGSFIDDTSAMADLILPDHSFLESWVDAAPESGSLVAVHSVAAPAMKPIHDTRATGDVLLDVAGKLRKPLPLGATTYDEFIKTAFASLPAAADGTDAWTLAQKQGGWWPPSPAATASQGSSPAAAPRATAPQGAAAGRGSNAAATYAAPQLDGDAGQYPFYFLPYPSSLFLDGSLAHLPWLQEQPDPITSAMWSTWVEINPATAARLGIAAGDVVEVASAHGSVKAGAVLSPGIAPNIIAMPVGQGHQSFTRFASGRGDNPVAILASVAEPETGSLAWAATRVKATRAGGPDGKLIMFAGSLREEGDLGR
jgi:anaerobic selenocysteine-containing dehydrogenase